MITSPSAPEKPAEVKKEAKAVLTKPVEKVKKDVVEKTGEKDSWFGNIFSEVPDAKASPKAAQKMITSPSAPEKPAEVKKEAKAVLTKPVEKVKKDVVEKTGE